MYVIVSATSSISCNFVDIDICGYQDLSKEGINWSHIRKRDGELIVHGMFYCS